jgi:hypothetical protein
MYRVIGLLASYFAVHRAEVYSPCLLAELDYFLCFVACSSHPLVVERKMDYVKMQRLVQVPLSSSSLQLICHIAGNFFLMGKLAGHIVGKS